MDTTVNNYPERFLTYLEVEKNCSQHTIESYQKDLAAFAEFMLRRNKQNFFWQQTGPLDVRGYLAELNEKQYALPFASDPRKLFKIGINFSNRLRNIEEWIIEE